MVEGLGDEGREVGCEGCGGEDVEGREERVNEADFFVGDKREDKWDEEANCC